MKIFAYLSFSLSFTISPFTLKYYNFSIWQQNASPNSWLHPSGPRNLPNLDSCPGNAICCMTPIWTISFSVARFFLIVLSFTLWTKTISSPSHYNLHLLAKVRIQTASALLGLLDCAAVYQRVRKASSSILSTKFCANGIPHRL